MPDDTKHVAKVGETWEVKLYSRQNCENNYSQTYLRG